MCKTKKIKLIQTAISILFIVIFNNNDLSKYTFDSNPFLIL